MAERVVGADFTDETINIDGMDYEDCTFTRCVLVYSGGDRFVLGGGNRFPDCQFRFAGAAERTLTSIRCLKQFGYDDIADSIISSLSVPFLKGKGN